MRPARLERRDELLVRGLGDRLVLDDRARRRWTTGSASSPGSACPHYDGEEMRRPSTAALVAEGFPAGHAADDGVGIVFEGTERVEAVFAGVTGRAPGGRVSATKMGSALEGAGLGAARALCGDAARTPSGPDLYAETAASQPSRTAPREALRSRAETFL